MAQVIHIITPDDRREDALQSMPAIWRNYLAVLDEAIGPDPLKCRRKFLRYYPRGFVDAGYLDLERGYKWNAHERWSLDLGKDEFTDLLQAREFGEIAARAIGIEARTNLLFSFEKMALGDAVKGAGGGAKSFSEGLFEFLHSDAALKRAVSRTPLSLRPAARSAPQVLKPPRCQFGVARRTSP